MCLVVWLFVVVQCRGIVLGSLLEYVTALILGGMVLIFLSHVLSM